MSRTSEVEPLDHNLIHFFGDLHHGDLFTAKAAKVTADVTTEKLMPTPVLRVCVGDFCDDVSAPQKTTALAFMNGLSGSWITAIGNHDINGNATTPDAAAISYGMSGASFVRDLPFTRVIVLGPVPFWDLVGLPQAIGLSQATLDFLAASLTSAPAGVPCIIVCHAPLKGTVAGGSTVGYDSNSAGFFIYGPNLTDDTEVRAVLNAHSNAAAWICGHTHTQTDTAGLVALVNVGSRSIAHVVCSSIHYTGGLNSAPPTDAFKKQFGAMRTFFVNVFPTYIEVRMRDHGAGIWYGPSGIRVTTLTWT